MKEKKKCLNCRESTHLLIDCSTIEQWDGKSAFLVCKECFKKFKRKIFSTKKQKIFCMIRGKKVFLKDKDDIVFLLKGIIKYMGLDWCTGIWSDSVNIYWHSSTVGDLLIYQSTEKDILGIKEALRKINIKIQDLSHLQGDKA